MGTTDVRRSPTSESRSFLASRVTPAFAFVCATALASPAAAQLSGTVQTPTFCAADARVTEWDIPANMDNRPGAMVVDMHASEGNRVWFVTRAGIPPRVYRIRPRNRKQPAEWRSWQLAQDSGTTGGLKKIKVTGDSRFVFVRSTAFIGDTGEPFFLPIFNDSVQRIDTANCKPHPSDKTLQVCQGVEWSGELPDPGSSDLDTDRDGKVYTVVNATDPNIPPPSNTTPNGYLQRLVPSAYSDPASTIVPAVATRWNVGGGAGLCPAAENSAPCISGVAVHPKYPHLVYYAEPQANNLSELDTRVFSCTQSKDGCSKVRRWNLSQVVTPATATTLAITAREPRQVRIDNSGEVWVVTGGNADNGFVSHLIQLDPVKNRIAGYQIPESENDPFALAPDSERGHRNPVGYTAANPTLNKVAMLLPNDDLKNALYKQDTVAARKFPFDGIRFESESKAGTADPMNKTVVAQFKPAKNGTFVETNIATAMPDNESTADEGAASPSTIPLGITHDERGPATQFLYAVGESSAAFNRVGRIRMPRKPGDEFGRERDNDDHDDDGERDDHDKDDDDDGMNDDVDKDDDNDCVNDDMDDDDDEDGIKDKDDRKGEKENHRKEWGQSSGGQSAEFPVTTTASTSVILATVTASDPLALISIEIVNPSGIGVASPLPTPGAAVASVIPTGAGIYTVRVKNHSAQSVNHTTTMLTREPWPLLP
jgi:hypothetical protein